jgi:DNA-binding NarL/FixJ family response regulator
MSLALPTKILVVEDFEQFRRFIVSALQRRPQFQVTEASNGLEALQEAETLQPDLVLLDIGLPHLNGMEVARRLRKLAPAAKILFVSQERSPDVVREALRLGALGYVQKPRAGSDLLPAIDAALEGRRFVSAGLEVDAASDDLADHSHELLFCGDEQTLLDAFTHFIVRALRTRNPALVLATKSHERSLLERLRASGVDIDASILSGTYVSFDADEELDSSQFFRAIEALREAASKAGKEHPRVAFCGEGAGRLWATGKTDEAIRLEHLCAELTRSHEVEILCVYPLPGDREDEGFKNIRREHTHVSFR